MRWWFWVNISLCKQSGSFCNEIEILCWSSDVFGQWGEVNGREDCDQINVKQGNYDVVDFDLGDEDYADKDDEDVDNDADDVDDDDLGPGCPH